MKDFEKLRPIPLKKIGANPLVSILMANYNYAEFINESIESVINQTYSNWELIICDDGSSDNSVELVEKYCKQDKRIKLICKDNGGQASALNSSFYDSNGDIICLLDADDFFYPSKLMIIIEALIENYNSGLCIHKLLPINSYGKKISKIIPGKLEDGWTGERALAIGGGSSKLPPSSGLTFRREILDIIFPIPTIFKTNADAVLSELSLYLTNTFPVNKALSSYRIHSKNITASYDNASEETIEKNYAQIPLFTNLHRDFLRKRFGESFSSRWKYENREGYWDSQLALYILKGKVVNCNQKLSGGELISKINNNFRKAIWFLLLVLPNKLSIKILKVWWSPSIFKKYLSLLLRLH